MRRTILAILLAIGAAGPATAQGRLVAGDCGRLANLLNVVEPWEQNTRTFYSGQVRVVFADTVEPACCWAHLLVLVPDPGDAMELRRCVAVNQGNGRGFAGLDFAALAASYDPAVGLTIRFPYALDDQRTGATGPWRTGEVTVNLATGTVSVR